MFTQLSGPGVPQRRTRRLPFLVHACTKRRYAIFSSLLSHALLCLFLKTCWERIFSCCVPDICRGRDITVLRKAARHSRPVAGDTYYFSFITFAEAKSVFPPVFARDRPAPTPAQQKEPTEAYVYEVTGNPAKRRTHIKEGLFQSAGSPQVDEANNDIDSEPPRNPAVLKSAQLNGADRDSTGKPAFGKEQRNREEKAEKLQRILDLFISRNFDTKGTDLTHSAPEGDEGRNEDTHSGIFGNNVFIHREGQEELMAARMQRVIAAHQQRGSGGLTNEYEKLDTVRPTETRHTPESSSIESGISREDAVVQEDPRGSTGTSDSLGILPGNEEKTPQELTQRQIEKIQRGIQFTQKFDFDKAWEEALQTSKARLVWNITYTDEYSMAQKMYEKMEAYVLRKYIALLKQKRELQKIPIVGNPQLMHLLRSLLKREHIKTTKTDAEIARLFRHVPRLFDWIPSVEDGEEGTDNTTRERYLVDEL